MPRDASRTRELLIDAGRELFATDGVFSVPLSRIVAKAEQKNESALHYHFGGRQGLLNAIIDVTNGPIEARRRELLDQLGDEPDLERLVGAYIRPQTDLLGSVTGRQFLSIVSQLDDLFDDWEDPLTPVEAGRAIRAIAESLGADLTARVRHERITRFLGLVAEALGARARAIDRGREPMLDQTDFVQNLVAMSVGALSAAAPRPIRADPQASCRTR